MTGQKAKFVVVEGIDGSGKSSIVGSISKKIGAKDIIITEEPTETWLGDAVRRSHAEKLNPLTEAFLFLADRVSHTEKIKSWLSENRMVICDRYYHSTVAYQGAALEDIVDFDPFIWLLDINRRVSIEPDIVFLLRIDPELALSRINSRKKLSKFENLKLLQKVARNYDRLAELSENCTVIDASKSPESVLEIILAAL